MKKLFLLLLAAILVLGCAACTAKPYAPAGEPTGNAELDEQVLTLLQELCDPKADLVTNLGAVYDFLCTGITYRATLADTSGGFTDELTDSLALELLQKRKGNCDALAALTALVSFGGFFLLLTPAAWDGPLEYLQYVLKNASQFSRWTGVVLFRGQRYDQAVASLPRSYLPRMMLYTLPLYFFPLCAVGQLAAVREWFRRPGKCLREPEKLLLLCATLLWALFMGYVILRQPVIYNGWRHFYFLYAGFIVLAAWGLETLLRRARGLNGAAIAGILALCMAADGVGILQNHPYQYAYYNFLAPADAEETMELDYWDVSTVNALRLLLDSERNEALPLTVSGTDDLSQLGLEQALSALTEEENALLTVTEQPEDASYLLMNTTYGRIYGVTVPRDYHVLAEIRSYGHTICTVYERMEKGMWRD